MSKTFGELRAGDEVYVINEGSLDISRVKSIKIVSRYAHIDIGEEYGEEYSVPSYMTSFYDDMVGRVYCDIDEAMRKMQEIRDTAWYDFQCASGSLNLLEAKKRNKKQQINNESS